jgi:hypothetical protein
VLRAKQRTVEIRARVLRRTRPVVEYMSLDLQFETKRAVETVASPERLERSVLTEELKG